MENKHQIKAYNKILKYIEERTTSTGSCQKPHFVLRTETVLIHEKEREFLDCLRLIIQNGYRMKSVDILDVLRFIQLSEVFFFESAEQDQVIEFLK